jgi:N-acetylneuraminate epimerase
MIISMIALNCAEQVDEIQWQVIATLPSVDGINEQPGLAGPVTGVINDHLLVSGGANFPGGMPWNGAKKVYHDEIYLFERKNKGDITASVSNQKLPQPVAYCANVITPEGLVYLGGENQQGILSSVVLVKFNALSNELVFTELPSLPMPLTNLSAAYSNHIIYAGGGNSTDGTSSKFFSLDVSNPGAGWQLMPDIPVKIAYAVMVAQSSVDQESIYLIGGRRKNSNGLSDIFNTVYQFDTGDSAWKQRQSLPYSVSAAAGIAYYSNGILLFGGDKGETFSREENLSSSIRNETDEGKKRELTLEKIALMETHPGFTSEVLLYNTIGDTWEKVNSLPAGAPVTTTAIKWGNEIIIPSGEIKAGIRTPKILMGEIKAGQN